MATHSNGKIQPRQPIAIVRLDDLEQAVEISRALLAGGITAQEFTLTNPHALEALAQVKKELPGDLLLGAGTVLGAARRSFARRGHRTGWRNGQILHSSRGGIFSNARFSP